MYISYTICIYIYCIFYISLKLRARFLNMGGPSVGVPTKRLRKTLQSCRFTSYYTSTLNQNPKPPGLGLRGLP